MLHRMIDRDDLKLFEQHQFPQHRTNVFVQMAGQQILYILLRYPLNLQLLH